MTQIEFLKKIKASFDENLDIVRAKNADYSGTDALRNFRACEVLGITAETGILVRMSDKLARCANLLEKKECQVNESLGDTLSDLANYAMILKVLIESKEATF